MPPTCHTARNLLAIGLLGAFALACAGCGDEAPVEQASAWHRGLWVLCEGSQRVLDHPSRIPALIEDAHALGATDLFVQVYRGGRAWYDSSLADATPYRRLLEANGVDTLAELLSHAHAAGLRVHAWVNVLSLADNKRAPLIEALGRDAVLVDQRGRSILDYPGLDVPPPDRTYYRMGTPGVWIDPAAPGVAVRLAQTFGELLTRYPALDGLHLDYIRYPGVLPFAPGSRFGVGLDFGHGKPTRARFRAETGLEAPGGGRLANANRWDAWRRDKVTELVRGIGEAAQAARPGLLLSAAVWSHADRAYLSVGQDWRGWLEEGLLDFAVPMNYTLDTRLFRYQVEAFAHGPLAPRVWIGIGTWLFAKRPARAVEQVRLAQRAGAAGDALFSWDSIAEAPELRAALAEERREGAETSRAD